MYCKSMLSIAFIAVIFVSGASGLSLNEFLFQGVDLPEDLQLTHEIALKEEDRIEELRSSVKNLVAFLPSNAAWENDMAKYEALQDEERAASVRYDLLLACSADAPVSSDWASLLSAANDNNGVLDTAYGTPYFLLEGGRICTAVWDDAEATYVEGACANVHLPPVDLDDARIYMIDRVILPEAIEDEINELI